MKQTTFSGVTRRALIIGAILIPPNSYWIMQTEMAWYSGRPTIVALFFNVIFCIFLLALLNALWTKLSSQTVLNQRELIVIFMMLSSASAVAGWDMMQALVPVIGHAFWYATPENEWRELFWRHLPTWLTVQQPAVLHGYYKGESTLYTIQNFKSWAIPALSWSLFIIALVWVMICLNVLIRRQWTEVEKLRYPVIQLPLEMTRPAFLRNKLLWAGFLIAGSIDLLNGLGAFFPKLPIIPVKRHDISYLFPERPWSAIGWTPVSFYPAHPMPHQLEGFKLAERVGIQYKRLVFVLLFATVLGTFSAFWAFLHIAYRTPGGVTASGTGPQAFTQLQMWLLRPVETDSPAVIFAGFGLILSFCLMVLRSRFLWWPLHPAGYALSGAWTMNMLWLPLFFSWLIKAMLLRYGGLKMHQQAVPFFLGLILGEFIVGSFWSIFCAILGHPAYTFWI